MNKTEAKFTTIDISIVAFLLWKGIVPTKKDFNGKDDIFLYYESNNYNRLMEKYWEGDYVPACEMGQCYSIGERLLESNSPFDIIGIREELSHLQDYMGMYSKEITIGELDGLDSDIIKRLDEIEEL